MPCAAIIGTIAYGPAHAARPLTTDDAGTAPAGSCQIESWVERNRDHRVAYAVPGCGLAEGIELDLGVSRDVPRGDVIDSSATASTGHSLALKFAPAWAVVPGTLGTWSFAWKAEIDGQRAAGHTEHLAGQSTTGIAALAIGPSLSLLANVSAARDAVSGSLRGGALIAASWQPGERALGYVELLRPPGASAQLALGTRWWLVPGRLGLDLGAARGGPGGTTLNLGLSWYGLGGG